ncbi:hypothetical protein Pan258_22270 [Symmachiella dynata]|uniref:hypothetical protein n=1 Tax=Symmachiella dynata TaxID=2527995 RepID=UPI001188824B|nr:hypothetical protein [Symmachiella dynata]QDT48187.1 hypothetical protein Pan258_22270 [Symmachiella dynata]
MVISTLSYGVKQVLRQDVPAIQCLLKRIRHDERFADLSLFKRRCPNDQLRQDERRARDRYPLCWPIEVLPVNFDEGVIEYVDCPLGEIQVYSQDVTLRGISFLHSEPLQTSHAVLTYAPAEEESISLLLEICWTAAGWEQPFPGCGKFLMSGGKFLGIVDSLPGE